MPSALEVRALKILAKSDDISLMDFKAYLGMPDHCASDPFFSFANRKNWVVLDCYIEYIRHLIGTSARDRSETVTVKPVDQTHARLDGMGSTESRGNVTYRVIYEAGKEVLEFFDDADLVDGTESR